MRLSLIMTMNCTVCGRRLRSSGEHHDEESVRDAHIAIHKGNCPDVDDPWEVCPSCSQVTHNRRVVAKIRKLRELETRSV